MLPVDSPFTPWVLGVAMVALFAMLAYRIGRKDRREYQRFRRYHSTARRQEMFRKWLRESVGWFGGSAVVSLVLVWQFIPRMLAQVESWPPTRAFRGFLAEGGGFLSGLIAGASVAFVAVIVLSVYLARNAEEVPTLGDIHALLPRNRAELKYGWGLSINAGVVEELLFRLALPTLIFGVIGNALIAIIASMIVFGVLHAYQGVWGVVGSLFLGALFMLLFLATGSILWPILAHALFDLRSLVLIPVVAYKVHRVSS